MREPSLRTSRMAIAGGVMGAAALAAAGFLLGRVSAPKPQAVDNPVPVASASAAPAIDPLRVLRRAELVMIGERASEAFVIGAPTGAGGEDIAGRRFELVIPFGCNGPQDDDSGAPLRWRYDAAAQTLRVHVAPAVWTAADWDLSDPQGLATLDGFWVSRPWNPAEYCPKSPVTAQQPAAGASTPAPIASASAAAPAPAAGEPASDLQPQPSLARPAERTLAVVSLRAADARRESNQRPYSIVRRMPPEAFAPASGFHLRLSGRIDRLPSGASTRCVQPADIDQRPACAIAVALDEVAIANPLDGATLAAWSLRPDVRREP